MLKMLWSWGYFLGVVIGGFVFYWLRCTHKVLYGCCETFVSLIIAYIACFPQGGGTVLTADDYVAPSLAAILASRAVAFFASVYVFVRGSDNIGLKDIVLRVVAGKGGKVA
jgi:hypothetical protein